MTTIATSGMASTTQNGISRWLADQRANCTMRVREIPFARSAEWTFDGSQMRHVSGGFFSVVGARMVDRASRIILQQPIINQPEIGILGFAMRGRGEERETLVQAKAEPGNVGFVQAAPTVQATESNYLRKHHGQKTQYLNWFRSAAGLRVISDSRQSEQGTRFLGKYNRNVVVDICDKPGIEEPRGFKWFPLRDVLQLLAEDFCINTDARSVLASSDWCELATNGEPFSQRRRCGGFPEELFQSFHAANSTPAQETDAIAGRLQSLRKRCPFRASTIALKYLDDWIIGESSVRHGRRQSFEVGQVAVECAEREVTAWDQPIIASHQQGDNVLLCRRINGVLHFLFQARTEIGFREGVQFGPSIQMSGDESEMNAALDHQLLGLANRAHTLLSCLHSDEGGRFFQCVSRYRVCLLADDVRVDEHQSLAWMTLGQIEQFIKAPGFFNNEARSAISMLLIYV